MPDTEAAVVIWITEGTWQASVDAALRFVQPGAPITLLHVTPAELSDTAHGAYLGLFGRGRPDRDPGPHVAKLAAQSAADLLDAAAARLGRPAAGSSAAASSSGKWSPRWPTRPCSSWPGTATAPAWAPRAWERRPASSSTTRPARFWSSGRKPPRR